MRNGETRGKNWCCNRTGLQPRTVPIARKTQGVWANTLADRPLQKNQRLWRFKVDASMTHAQYISGQLPEASARIRAGNAMLNQLSQGENSMDIAWPVFGITVIVMGISWSMERGVRKQREKRMARRSHPVTPSTSELHCPHCGHVIGDGDFARAHSPFVSRPPAESPYFRRPRNGS